MEDCIITSITKAGTITAIHEEPKFSELFMAYLLTRNSRIEGSDRPAIQFEPATAGAAAFAAREFQQGRQPATESEHRSGNIGEDDWHHAIPRQPFHEQVLQAGPHQLQRAEVHNSLLSAVLHEKPQLSEDD